jgi:hypothetical protein
MDFGGPGTQKFTADFGTGGARGHNVVNDGNNFTLEGALYGEGVF